MQVRANVFIPDFYYLGNLLFYVLQALQDISKPTHKLWTTEKSDTTQTKVR